jgi:hypothetical protein
LALPASVRLCPPSPAPTDRPSSPCPPPLCPPHRDKSSVLLHHSRPSTPVPVRKALPRVIRGQPIREDVASSCCIFSVAFVLLQAQLLVPRPAVSAVGQKPRPRHERPIYTPRLVQLLVCNPVTVASPASFPASSGQRRRRSSAATHPPNLNLQDYPETRRFGTTSGLSSGSRGDLLPTIPGTPAAVDMTSRSPSPRPGGWSSPGLNTPYDSGGRTSYANGTPHNVTWASAQARSAEVKGHTTFNPRGQGFIGKHFRRLSTSLPFSYGDKEKLGRGRYVTRISQALNRIGRSLWRLRRSAGLVLFIVLGFIVFYATRKLGLQY